MRSIAQFQMTKNKRTILPAARSLLPLVLCALCSSAHKISCWRYRSGARTHFNSISERFRLKRSSIQKMSIVACAEQCISPKSTANFKIWLFPKNLCHCEQAHRKWCAHTQMGEEKHATFQQSTTPHTSHQSHSTIFVMHENSFAVYVRLTICCVAVCSIYAIPPLSPSLPHCRRQLSIQTTR